MGIGSQPTCGTSAEWMLPCAPQTNRRAERLSAPARARREGEILNADFWLSDSLLDGSEAQPLPPQPGSSSAKQRPWHQHVCCRQEMRPTSIVPGTLGGISCCGCYLICPWGLRALQLLRLQLQKKTARKRQKQKLQNLISKGYFR